MTALKDLTGQTFGKWQVLERSEQRVAGRVAWECLCECGTQHVVAGNNLLRGLSTRCRACGQTSKDVTGKRFGQLVALRATKKRKGGSVVWECRCDCGKETEASLHALETKNKQSCGCLARLEIAGQRFGRLTAIKPLKERKGQQIVWECLCDCGQRTNVVATSLNKGATRSCGCLNRELISKDLSGQRFGKLVAVRPTEQRNRGSIVWECLCDCGQLAKYSSKNLQTGDAVSCGCSTTANDLTGQVFGRLTALAPTEARRNNSVVWRCRCSCGEEALVPSECLVHGKSRSCGCLAKEVQAVVGPKNLREESFRAYAEDPDYAARESLVYLVEVAGVVDKIGIAFDLDARSYKAEYTEVWWTRTMKRAECWAVEQAALELTKDWIPETPYVGDGKSGPTEQRTGWVIEEAIELLEGLADECERDGWQTLWDRYCT